MWYNCHKSRHCMWHLEAVYIRELLRPTACKNTIDYRHLTFWFLQHSKQMLQINVTLPNGHHELLRVPQSSTVGDLKSAAQQAFGQNFLRLITAKPRALVDLEESLVAAGLEDGDYLSAVILQPQLAATAGAFALWCCGGNTVITWGNADLGGDSSAVQDRLKNVQQIQATESSFAAMLADGSIVTWGDEHSGGDSSGVEDQLKNVQQIQATGGAFAAILADGSIVTWGNVDLGGDSTAVQDELKHVQQILATDCAFTAILANGSIVTWGNEDFGGKSSGVRDQLKTDSTADSVRRHCIRCGIGRWNCFYLGQQTFWWRQFSSPRPAQACAADSGHSRCIRCKASRWINRHLGRLIFWWWQLSSPRSSQKCAAGWGHRLCICCNTGRWVTYFLGRQTFWWRQFRSRRSAQECAADSGHRWCIRRDSGRWINSYLGKCRFGWWQHNGARSAEGSAADSGHGCCIRCNTGRWVTCHLGRWRLWWRQLSHTREAHSCLIVPNVLLAVWDLCLSLEPNRKGGALKHDSRRWFLAASLVG